MKYFKILFVILVFSVVNSTAQTQSIDSNLIIPYLDRIIAWHNGVKSIEVSQSNAQEILLNNSLRKTADKALNSAFDLAKAEAVALTPKNANPQPEVETAKSKLAQYAEAAQNDADQIAAQLDDINNKIASTSGPERNSLILKRKTLESGVKLIKARQDLLQNATKLSTKPVTDESGLIGQINNLARSLPEIQNGNNDEQKAPVAKTETSTLIQSSNNSDSQGIIGLTSDMWGQLSKQKYIRNLLRMNTALRESNQVLLDNLRNELKSTIQQGNAIADSISNTADADIATQKITLDNLTADFKTMSNLILPLSQTNTFLDSSKKTLESWDRLLLEDMHKTLHRLAIRLAILSIAILIPLVLSRLAHNATMRYVKDPKRQRQLRIVRRTVFGIIIGLVILLNLITEYGSLVTFAGFVTAGIAVALQTVILSLVAHFFFLGRYGIKVGDQISIGGATGEVIKVGMIRFYVMELTGTDFNLNPTGRIVIYPNSVLFQPAAFTKLIPGTSYTWSEIRVKLDPSTDYDLADRKLNETVTKVYANYKEIMAHQQTALQQATHYGVKIPAPKAHLRVTDAGFIFLVRYPIAISKASEIKDRFTKELLETIKQEPGLKLA